MQSITSYNIDQYDYYSKQLVYTCLDKVNNLKNSKIEDF